MTVAARTGKTEILTYERYLAEGEIMARYDIIDGVREYMPNPTRQHQKTAINIVEQMLIFERAYGTGEVCIAPCDVLITRVPLRIRQPDVLFISKEQLAKCAPATDPAPLEVAPELVVEILSPSEKPNVRDAKIRDYCAAGVKECWRVRLDNRTVEVLRLTADGAESVAVYAMGQTVRSLSFPDLAVSVNAIFDA